jgi:hypothetical protein
MEQSFDNGPGKDIMTQFGKGQGDGQDSPGRLKHIGQYGKQL